MLLWYFYAHTLLQLLLLRDHSGGTWFGLENVELVSYPEDRKVVHFTRYTAPDQQKLICHKTIEQKIEAVQENNRTGESCLGNNHLYPWEFENLFYVDIWGQALNFCYKIESFVYLKFANIYKNNFCTMTFVIYFVFLWALNVLLSRILCKVYSVLPL